MDNIDRLFFTSDQHFGHTTAVRDNQHRSWGKNARRQFESVEAMNEAMIQTWNAEVPETAEVYMLGDFVYYGSGRENKDITLRTAAEVLGKLSGVKHLIVGNHDLPFDDESMAAAYLEAGFTSVTRGQTSIDIGDKVFDLCHFPRWRSGSDTHKPEIYPKACTDWPRTNWLIHGHTHNRVQVNPGQKAIDVGVDAWSFRPVAARTLLELCGAFENISIKAADAHHCAPNAYTVTDPNV